MGKLKAIKEAVEAAGRQLDMSTSARMARAAEQGFDTSRVYYHGTMSDKINGFRVGPHDETDLMGVAVTPDPALASDYAVNAFRRGTTTGDSPNVIPVYLRGENISQKEWLDMDIPDGVNQTNSLKRRGVSGVDVLGGGQEVFVLRPENIRSVNAKFDPANIGKNDLLGSVDPRLLAPIAAGAAGAMYVGDQLSDPGLPPLDPAYAEFARRREAKRDTWRQLKESVWTLGSAMAGGIVGDLSRLGGYLNPFMPVEQTEQGAQGIENSLMYQPTGPNRYLEGLGRGFEQAQEDFAPLTDQIPQSIPGRVYNALPERAQGILRIGADLAL